MSGTVKEIVRQRFGRLLVISRAGSIGSIRSRRSTWLCRCDCGTEKIIAGDVLRRGDTRSCGCLRVGSATVDLTGQTFGLLVVVSLAGVDKHKRALWHCKCNCGTEVVVSSSGLRAGSTKSCGCTHYRHGEQHHSWRGGITELRHAIRNLLVYREWRDAVFHRDNFTCQKCGGGAGGNLNAHHLKPFQQIIDEYKITTVEQAIACAELWDIWNGITLCKTCHDKIHTKE